jgi:hypothetical protein
MCWLNWRGRSDTASSYRCHHHLGVYGVLCGDYYSHSKPATGHDGAGGAAGVPSGLRGSGWGVLWGGPVKTRAHDERTLAILEMRHHRMPAHVAKKFGITREKVVQICAEIKNADIKISTKNNVETLYEILLHYPHR